ncbi:hypothetical protein SK128_006741 [Halocaridina rubra]|uniref:Carbohydrate sulfotransferase n=1 Tax=Halocaridina rubra TaxID=373956 RepID=A0AAN8X0M5_HALRR
MAHRAMRKLFVICLVCAASTIIFYLISYPALGRSYGALERTLLTGDFSDSQFFQDLYNEENGVKPPVFDELSRDGGMDGSFEADEYGTKTEELEALLGVDGIENEDDYTEEPDFMDSDEGIPNDEEVAGLIADYEDDDAGIKSYNSSQNVQSENDTSSSSSGDQEKSDVKLYQNIDQRFTKRLQKVKEVCRKYNYPGMSKKYTKRHLLYYSKRYDLLVCLCAKVGSSTWKSHLLHMKGLNPNTRNVHTNYWENKVKASNIIGSSLDKRIKTSTMILTARHPLDRLVSAFRDKFCDGKAVDKPQSDGHYRYFWRPAMRSLHKGRTRHGKLQISFVDFLKYVIIDQSQSTLGDRHWSRIFRACSVCKMKYDYIMKLETYTEDLLSLRRKFNVTELNVYDKRHSKSGNNPEALETSSVSEVSRIRSSTLNYFLKVPPYLIARILKIYRVDFEMFGYEIPPQLRDMIKKRGNNSTGTHT